jgi:hypothetical protein
MNTGKANFLFWKWCILFLVLYGPTLISCSKKISNSINYNFKSADGIPDYSNLNYWASHPSKTDPADNIPSSLQNSNIDSIADVFFIHPTTYTKLSMPWGWNAGIDDQSINKKTDNGTILYQASVFNQRSRIFAPRYRQANLKAFYTTNKEEANKAFDIAYKDVKTAFEYYLRYYNRGRPIIIASHSQGTLHAGRLLKEYFENKQLQQQLICAYLIGLPVFTNYFKVLQPCKDSTATSCFISWRTIKEEHIPQFVKIEKDKAYVTNPLSWTLDENFAPSSLNKGGILRDFNKVIPALVHAKVHGNVLWVNKPQFFGSVFLTMKNYHIADYNLFYVNIRDNIETRIKSYLNSHH